VSARPLRIGLTGGIASGKSTVARMFAALGVPVIDTDEIARAVVAPGQPALAEIVAAFGPGYLATDGTLDRRRLRHHVFADPGARSRLERMLHPHIEAATLAAMAAAGGPYQIIVVPLLVEAGFGRHVDRVLVIDCPEDLQRERLGARDGSSAQEAGRMLAAQASRAERLRHGDDVLTNEGDLDALRQGVADLHRRYTALAAAAPGP
jgi:dephospho-CoA kinase